MENTMDFLKILIIRFSSFGDVLLTTPILDALKDKYPNSKIDFIVYDTFSEAITLNPNINETIIFKKKNSKNKKYIYEIIDSLKEKKYDYVIDLHSKYLSYFIGKSLSNKNTKYLKYKKRKWWKTILVKAKLINYNADCTIVESYFTGLKQLNIKFNQENIKKGLGDNLSFYYESAEEKILVEKYDLLNKKYVVLAPGASKFTKKWPHYDKLSIKILENTDFHIFVIGGKEDFSTISENTNYPNRLINLCGKISFKESGIILKHAFLSIVNDSGPFHISRALKTKTYVFFGPTDPKLFSFEKDTHLFYNKNCKPHSLYGDNKFPKKYKDCMSGISVEEVFNTIFNTKK